MRKVRRQSNGRGSVFRCRFHCDPARCSLLGRRIFVLLSAYHQGLSKQGMIDTIDRLLEKTTVSEEWQEGFGAVRPADWP